MNIKHLAGVVAFAAIGLAACGGSGYGKTAAPTQTSAPSAAAAATASLKLESTPLGQIVADAEGHTLYAFTNDAAGVSTCTGACAKVWPAAIAPAYSMAGPGITAAVTSIAAPGGGEMLKAGRWPLYRFAGDAAAGDTNGQGSGGTWFVVRADGTLVKS